MKVKDLIKKLEGMPQDKEVMAQLCPTEGEGAWGMFFEVRDLKDLQWVRIRIWHPELTHLPDWPTDNKPHVVKKVIGLEGGGPAWVDPRSPAIRLLDDLLEERVRHFKEKGIGGSDPMTRAKDDMKAGIRGVLGW